MEGSKHFESKRPRLEYLQAINETVVESSVPKNSAVPFLTELQKFIDAGSDFTTAMHNTMNLYNINWNDENYNQLSFLYKSKKETVDDQLAIDNEISREIMTADAITHEKNINPDDPSGSQYHVQN